MKRTYLRHVPTLNVKPSSSTAKKKDEIKTEKIEKSSSSTSGDVSEGKEKSSKSTKAKISKVPKRGKGSLKESKKDVERKTSRKSKAVDHTKKSTTTVKKDLKIILDDDEKRTETVKNFVSESSAFKSEGKDITNTVLIEEKKEASLLITSHPDHTHHTADPAHNKRGNVCIRFGGLNHTEAPDIRRGGHFHRTTGANDSLI